MAEPNEPSSPGNRMADEMLTEDEVAAILKVSRSWLAKRRMRRRVPFEGARYQCACESLPHTRGLGQVKIAAAAPRLCPKPLQFLLVGLPELIPREAARVVDAAEDHQRAHLEASGEAIERATQVPTRLIFDPQDGEGHQQLGRNLAAPVLNIMRRHGDRPDVRECRPAQP